MEDRVAAFVDERYRGVEETGVALGAFHTARIRRDHRCLPVEFLGQVVGDDREGSQRVERLVDETLKLPRVQIDGNETVGAGGHEKVDRRVGR